MAPAPTRRGAAPARRSAEAAPSRAPAPRTASRNTEAPRTSARGAAALRRMQEEQVESEARAEARKATQGAPFRFFCQKNETRQIVIVDELPDFVRKEHALPTKGTNRWDTFVPCIDEVCNCPACAVAERPAYFALYLTIIDLTPYTNKDGDEVPFSKKLLVVKPTQQKKIVRLYERHKTLRGMILDMTRDGEKDAAIGGDIEFVDFMGEEELQGYVYDYEDKEGKVHEVDCSEPFAYEEFMPDMTEQQLMAIVGGRPSPGNRASADRELRDDWDEPPKTRAAGRRRAAAEDDVPEPAARRPAARRAAAPEPEQEDDDQQDDAQETAAPARRAAPAGRRRAAEPEAEDPPFEPDEEQEEAAAPPARRAAPAARRTAAEDPPQRPARDSAAVAQRRASLRR